VQLLDLRAPATLAMWSEAAAAASAVAVAVRRWSAPVALTVPLRLVRTCEVTAAAESACS